MRAFFVFAEMRRRVILVAVPFDFFLRKRFRLLGSIRFARMAISPFGLNTPCESGYFALAQYTAFLGVVECSMPRGKTPVKPFKSSEECFNSLREWAQKWK